jgi:hypothetical protein
MLNLCTDPDGLTRQVNIELHRLWRESGGCADNETARRELQAIETRISNIRKAIEEGLQDAFWANSRLRELIFERDGLRAHIDSPGPPQLDSATVRSYCRQAEKLMVSGEPAERKRLMRAWVHGVTLEPENLEVKISYRLPDFVMKGVVAGACNVAIHNALASHFMRRWFLPRNGRRLAQRMSRTWE